MVVNLWLGQIMIHPSPEPRGYTSVQPGTSVQVLYPPYVEGALGVITARESRERWLISIPEDDLRPEPLLLSLREPEFIAMAEAYGSVR